MYIFYRYNAINISKTHKNQAHSGKVAVRKKCQLVTLRPLRARN